MDRWMDEQMYRQTDRFRDKQGQTEGSDDLYKETTM